MKTKNIILYIVICLIIIAGLIVWKTKGFNLELQYSARKQIGLSNYTGIETSDIEGICSEVLGNTKFLVQRVETFGNAVSVISDEMSEEQKNQIIDKFNKKYGTETKSEDVKIEGIASTKIKDIIRKFVFPGIITLAFVFVYFVIRFRKIGWKKVCLETIFIPTVLELLIFSIIAITRIPFSRTSIAVGVGAYIISVIVLTVLYENKREQYLIELEKNNK